MTYEMNSWRSLVIRNLGFNKIISRRDVIQRRGKYPYQQDFQRDWESYKNGFGNITQEFWLGNENIRLLCAYECKIRFDFQAKNGEKRFATYQRFQLFGTYSIYITDYFGNAGDSMKHHNYFEFSTKDRGNIEKAKDFQGGWWYGDAVYANLNGMYQPGKNTKQNVHWWEFREYDNLAKVEIKVMPK
ncbi:unnamed protein product [Larinioides sclopetarius]|uniref:Fibrinogen C-terminal domain-containing protein n=1 Tax=Larinioides sclopetarius TaxID=280406 RepID=A0AAV1ZD12_9ARAC